jgi:hypothetical protein
MLRDEKNKDLRWHIALEITNGDFQDKTSGEIADSILSLPTELEKVEKCKGHFNEIYKPHLKTCYCHGSGELITPLTLGEAVEVLKDTVEALERVAPYHDEKILYVALPDGSRVRRGR